jgi:hypothetical protein
MFFHVFCMLGTLWNVLERLGTQIENTCTVLILSGIECSRNVLEQKRTIPNGYEMLVIIEFYTSKIAVTLVFRGAQKGIVH